MISGLIWPVDVLMPAATARMALCVESQSIQIERLARLFDAEAVNPHSSKSSSKLLKYDSNLYVYYLDINFIAIYYFASITLAPKQ